MSDIGDRQILCVAQFRERLRGSLKPLITESLIEEHRKTNGLRRSDRLERVLAYFRSAAAADKYAILAVRAFAEYRIVRLSGKRGVAPNAVDDKTYASVAEAQHAVFIMRCKDLMKA